MADEAEHIETNAEAAPPSIRDSLNAAMGEQTGVVNASPIPASPVEAPSAERARAPDGKFAKAPEQAQTPSPTEPNAPAAAEPALQAIRPPASWSATAKADFAKLPEHIQQEVLKRESDIETGLTQQASKAERLNRLDAILGPRQEALRLRGIDETQALQTLFAAQDMLESPDPRVRANAIQHLARVSGVDLRSLVQADPQQQPQAQLPPVVQQMAQEIASLKQHFSQQQQSAHQQSASESQAQIDAFAADPANLYFANVRGDMAKLITSGQAAGLKDAYDKAIWANPEIRPILLREQQTQAAAEQERAAKARAEAARKASGSVTGSPTPGSAPLGGNPPQSVRAALEQAFGGA